MEEEKEPSDRKSPGFWFFPADYERDVQILSLAAQGLWMRMLCWMSDNEAHRGFLELPNGTPMTVEDIAARAGKDIRSVRTALAQMERIGIFDRDERACVLSRRMARDTHISAVRSVAASKRASIVERAKDGKFAGSKQPAKPQQNPTVPVVRSGSGSGIDEKALREVSSSSEVLKENCLVLNLTTTTNGHYATERDELVALIREHTHRQPEVKVIRDICEAVEIRSATLREYLDDIGPRILRLKKPPGEGFFLSQAKRGAVPAPEPETAEEKQIRAGPCPKCRNVGRVNGDYCDCRMATELKRVESRPKPEAHVH